MDIQNSVMMSNEEKNQNLSKQSTVKDDSVEMEKRMNYFRATAIMSKETIEDMEDAMFQCLERLVQEKIEREKLEKNSNEWLR